MTTQNKTTKDIPNYLVPMMVGPVVEETDEQYRARHKKFKSLADDVQEILASDETAGAIGSIARQYKFDETQIRNVARAVRLYYFGELTADGFAGYLEQNIPVQQKIAEAIAATVMRRIIHNEQLLPRETTTVKDALEKYTELRNHMITNRDIIVSGTQSLTRPTIGHWITDYHLSVGQGAHSSIQRGNYLFHNTNAQQLSDTERQRLAIVLKSWDEEIPLVVDPTKQKIVFPAQKVVTTPSTKKAVVTSNKLVAPVVTSPKSTTTVPHRTPIAQSVIDKVAAAKARTSAKASPSLTPTSTKNSNSQSAQINPANLRAQHVARQQTMQSAQSATVPHPRAVPPTLPVVDSQPATAKPSGFVSFSSKQKLSTEENKS